MVKLFNEVSDELVELLIHGVCVIPTDTLYGLSTSVSSQEQVEKIKRMKGRTQEQALIVLVSSLEQLKQFGVNESQIEEASKFWPGPVSIIMAVNDEYGHIGKSSTIAFRLPDSPRLQRLICLAGPIVSTSANKASQPPSLSAEEAIEIFGDDIAGILDIGRLNNPPSRIIKIQEDGSVQIIRR